MEAYGQFAWKLRHYRRGPPESNHSSNGPVCRHLGGRLDGTPYFLSRSFSTFTFPSRCLSFTRAPFPATIPTIPAPRERSLIRRGCSDYAEVSPPDHCGFIDTGRAGRSDLAAVRPIDVNDRAQPVSQIGELNGEAESLASRASFGQIRPARWESSTHREKHR